MVASVKASSINMRVDQATKEIIEKAAALINMNVSQFVLGKSYEAAEEILAFKTNYTVEDKEFYDFLEQLKKPQSDKAKALMARKPQWQ